MRLLVILLSLMLLIGNAYAARIIEGTLLASPGENGTIKISTAEGIKEITTNKDTKVLRSKIGSELKNISVSELAAGDKLTVNLLASGAASSIKAYYAILRATIIKVDKNSFILKDGSKVIVRPEAQIIFPGDKIGKLSDVKPASQIIAKIEPKTKEVWSIIVAKKAVSIPAKPKPPVTTAQTSKPAGIHPKITSLEFSAPKVIVSGDAIIVKMTGSANGSAVVEIKGLVPKTPLKETEQGIYEALIRTPIDMDIKDAPLIGYLSVGTLKAPPVQASKLINVVKQEKAKIQPVESTSIEPIPSPLPEPQSVINPEPAIEPIPAPIVQLPIIPVETSKLREIKPIVLISPKDGDNVNEIMINGTAEPNSKIIADISYSNQKIGLLNLNGKVISQLSAVETNGNFSIGPFMLEGPLSSSNLSFTISVYYADNPINSLVMVKVKK